MTVSYDSSPVKSVPKIEEKRSENVIGPRPLAGISGSRSDVKKKPVISMVLGPGLYRTIAAIPLLKEIKESNVNPVVIVGHGLSSVISAYYSLGFKPDYIEWMFFNFFNALEDQEPFKENWLEVVDEKLLKRLKGKRIEDGKITLLVPLWSEVQEKVVFLKRGDLREALLANIDPYNLLKLKYKQAFTHKLIPENKFKELGIDKIIVMDFLTNGLKWKQGSGFLNGTFQKAASVQINDQEKDDTLLWLSPPLGEYYLDDVADLSDLIHKSRVFSAQVLDRIKKEE